MTSTEKRLFAFAKLVNTFANSIGNEIIRDALNDKMISESMNILTEFAEKEKNDGRKKKTE